MADPKMTNDKKAQKPWQKGVRTLLLDLNLCKSERVVETFCLMNIDTV